MTVGKNCSRKRSASFGRDFTSGDRCSRVQLASWQPSARWLSSFHRANLAPSTTSFVILMARTTGLRFLMTAGARWHAVSPLPLFLSRSSLLLFLRSSSLIRPRQAASRSIVCAFPSISFSISRSFFPFLSSSRGLLHSGIFFHEEKPNA